MNDPSSPPPADGVRVLRTLGARLAVASTALGVEWPMPLLGSEVRGMCCGVDLGSAERARATIEPASGDATIHAVGVVTRHPPPEHRNRTQVELDLATGTLGARWSRITKVAYNARGRCDVDLSLERWRWRSERSALAWIGRAPGPRVWRGNAVTSLLDGDNRGSNACECFEGAGLRWLLVPHASGGDHELIIESMDGGEAPGPERVRDGLRALALVLGRRVEVDMMLGVDDRLDVCEAMSLRTGWRAQHNELLLIPNEIQRDQRWHAHLFSLLAARMDDSKTGGADFCYLATEALMDSADDHLEGATLKLSAALEAFCREGLQPTHDVRADEQAWARWVDSHAEEIRRLGVNPDRGEELVGRVRGLWRGEPSSRVVERYFEAKGVPLPADVVRALGAARNLAAHRYRVSKARYSDDFEHELERITLLQSCLFAALALEIGYQGPIEAGPREERPAWWPAPTGGPPPPYMFRCEAVAGSLPPLHSRRRTNEPETPERPSGS